MQRIGSTARVAACWYGPATVGSSFTVSVKIADGKSHKVSIYALDWDSSVRVQQVQVLDTATGTVLDNRTLSSFNGGEYLAWDIAGNVTIRFTKVAGANAVMDGLFFDPPQ